MKSSVAVSVVVPCYNEADVLAQTVTRLQAVCRNERVAYEIILVDDGSSDCTWEIIQDLAHAEATIVGLRLSRNFGHQAALTAGLRRSIGEQVFIIDADLQDPPELLGPMRTAMAEGHDVVYGQRLSREGETWFKLTSAHLFYKLLSFLSDIRIPENTGDFRLLSRRATDAFLALPETNRFIRGMVCWIGFSQKAFGYHRQKRAAGSTKYNLSKMAHFSLDAITSFSIRPLRLAALVGAGLLFASALIGLWVLYFWYTGGTIHGWASLMMVILLIGGVQIFLLGVIGEYIGRLFVEAKSRPLYFIRETTDSTAGAPN